MIESPIKPRKKQSPRPEYFRARYANLDPNISTGEYWGKKPVPPGYKLDRSGNIWPVPVRKGRVPPPEKRCVADSKTYEGQCTNWRMLGRTVCRMHGGAERQGLDHPNTKTGEQFRHGLFGDVLPPSLSQWYERAMMDPGIYDLTNNIAILSGRERELLSEQGRADWEKVEQLTEDLFDAMRKKDMVALPEILVELQKVAKHGRETKDRWKEIREIGENKRRLIETHRKRQLDMKMVVSADQLRALLRAFTTIVFDEIMSIPALAKTMIKREGGLDTGRLSMALVARIGKRMSITTEGMKAGKLNTDSE